MARTNNLTNFLTDVAAAIKTKKGYSVDTTIPAANFDTEVLTINTVNNQAKTATPTTSQQVIEPDVNYTGLSSVTIGAVTSSIDQNIVAGNIKSGITILGVQGTVVEVNNETKTITENGTYTPTSGKTGFSEVTVNVDSIPDGIFIQEATPTKTTSEALWLKEGSSTQTMLDKIPLDFTVKAFDQTDITYADVLNSLTNEQKALFNNTQYLLLVKNYYRDMSNKGYFLAGFNDYEFSRDNHTLVIRGTPCYKWGNYFESGSTTGYSSNLTRDGILNAGYWSSATLSDTSRTSPYPTIPKSDYATETGLYIDVDDKRYLVHTNKSNSWDKILDTSNADATAGDILTGKTAFVNNTKVTGSMPNNGAVNITPGVADQSIPAGYTSGGTVSGDANLVQANIRSGVTIFGVQGNLEPDKPDQTKTANPSTSQQVIEPDVGYELASVTITPVTAAIDQNIVNTNIKSGVTILGVTGTLVEGEMSHADYITALELAEDILGTHEYEDTMDILDDVDGVSSTYTGLGATEDEIEEVFDEILGEEEETEE